MPDTLYIIDVFSLFFQVYHGIPPMTGPAGQPTNAVFGFTRDLIAILRDKKPSHLVCAMDSEGKGIRNDWYPEYKANRSEMPEDMRPQIPMLEATIEAFQIPLIKYPGWEADDVLATMTAQAVERGLDVRIISSDKDCRQLLGPKVQMFNCRKNTYFDESDLKEVWGIRADQVIDFQSLVGDSVDNIPGVPLVGPKKAAALLEKFGTLEEVLANADNAPGKKLQSNLKEFADLARVSRDLVTLKTDLPIEWDIDACKVEGIDTAQLQKLFLEYGFRKFRQDVVDLGLDSNSAQNADASFEAAETIKERNWVTVDTDAKFDIFIKELKDQSEFCVDLETTALDAMQADIVGWAICWTPGTSYYIPVDGPPGQKTIDGKMVMEALKPLIEHPDIQIHNQNLKYDMLVMKQHGINLQGIGIDPMVAHYLLDAGARSHGLSAISEEYLQHRMIPITELIGKGNKQKKMFEVDVDRASEYASEDADVAFQLAVIVQEKLEKDELFDLYWNLERPLIGILCDMEHKGIKVDKDELKQQSDELGGILESGIASIYELAGREFNIDSPKQLREILFEELGLPVQKKTKTGPSTDQSVLEKLAAIHPLPEKIIQHRQLTKLKGTYLDALPELIHPKTGRIHTSFNQVVAATGRLSSNNPNLQNIPIRSEEGRRIRKAFIPGDEGSVLVCADYSQVELRILADLSDDPAMQRAFESGLDIHTAVAAEVFDVEESEVDKDMRRVAKAVNFGVIYGQSPFGLAAALKIPQDEAARFIDNYFNEYSGVEKFMEKVLERCVETGYAYTIRGRRRPIEGIKNTTGRNRNMPERTAINTVIQGSAADLIKQAMIQVNDRLIADDHPGRLLLQIHDELVFEVPESDQDSLVKLVREEMEQAMELSVPLVVDVAVGKNWHDVQPVA